jgi:hypothetical protein
LRGVGRQAVSKRPLAAAASTSTSTSTSDLAFVRRGTASTIIRAQDLFIVFVGRIEDFFVLRLDRRRFFGNRRDIVG